ncbi:putative protease 2 [Capnocytophaga sp. oral taxon 863 str. F0517]|uniref:S9 family peptidase n=1 Tax=Capnocytophaga sp. oral taxon 863 TaxID=1227265 RepID=UPI0003981CDC|nr:oligopeptidase B [Capnocytophaga sp. oral taxon 863]ERI64350.1 putative protease 2 [Capnocytophaga sp. oral taxon 863 str. F0517]
MMPPKAPKKEKVLEIHNDKRIDPYFWLNERDTPEVLSYLEAENAYFTEQMKHTEAFQKTLLEEMRSRIKEDDESVPYRYNGYWYYSRFQQGKEYPIYLRREDVPNAVEEVLFDVNEMAEGHKFYQFAEFSVSGDNQWASFSVDTRGRRMYSLFIKNLRTGEILPVEIKNTDGGSCWANDNQTIFYTKIDPQTLRSYKIYRHQLGTSTKEDVLVFHEKDETFNTGIFKSKSERFLIIQSDSTLSSESRFLESATPTGEFKIFQPRERGLEYDIAHYGDFFYVLNNAESATNFKLDKTPIEKTEKAYWQPVIPHQEAIRLEEIDIFKEYLVVTQRYNGLSQIHIIRWDGQGEHYLPFDNETYTASTGLNLDFDTEILRYTYNSMTTPYSVIDYNMRTSEKQVMKEQQVLGGTFDKENYTSERLWAIAADGTQIPISIVYRKGIKRDGSSPLLLYGYGSYGITIEPSFSTTRLSLLDRGFIFAIAHIRGGEYLGRPWYEAGKLLHKKNTFTDFIDCAKYLIANQYTSAAHLYAMGGSAGGLLMGAVINQAPELFHGVVANVPFVDVVTTMLDEEIPLTTGEYDEWGNPHQKEYYHYMLSYSPYDNVCAQEYPNLLVLTGYHDSQVQYWEPAKWVAKLRELKTDNNSLLFYTDMSSGHSGASGRYESLKEIVREYAFLFDLEHIQQ